MASSVKKGRRRVKFELRVRKSSEVYVAGSFNKWNPTKNQLKRKDGVFVTSVLLPKGKYEYKFIVNGEWCADPECLDWVQNEHGSLNSIRIVK